MVSNPQPAVADPENFSRYFAVRGRILRTTKDGAVDHIEALSHRYTGRPYAWYGGRDQVRVIITVEAEKVHDMMR